MSTIQFGGVVSGLNTQGIVDALVAAQKQPLTRLQSKEADLTSQKAAYSQLGAAIDDLVAKVKSFTVTSAGATRQASSADSSVFTATANTAAALSQYQISVDRLATATRAVSATSLGAAVTGAVDTSLMLSKANLATPVTTGNMTVTVDGVTTQFAVGDPTTTTLQSVMDGLAAALQAQIQAQGDTATVAASIVGGKIRLSISDNAVAHDISFGDTGDTSNLATALGLKTQGVTGTQNATVTGTAYLDPVLSSLNLPGSVTAGQISAIVDGQIVHYTVGDPTKTTMTQLLQGFSAAIQSQLRAGGANVGADAAATVTGSIVGNKVQLAVSGGALAHSLRFGAAGDASNALGLLGIANVTVSSTMNPTLTGATNLGVARTLGALDNAGLSGLTSTKTGVLTINGVAINYDTTSDTLSSIITRINNSSAGVIASLDRTNDQLVLTRKDTGAVAIDIQETSGTLGAALKLAPGTTNAQTIGATSQVTVDGRTIVSTTNTVTAAIDGVTLNLLKQSPLGLPQQLSVSVDQVALQSSLTAFITSFNNLGNTLDSLTAQTPGQAGGTAGSAGPLANDPTARSIFLSLRETLFGASGTGPISSLGAIGISTGAIGSLAGSTDRLQLDTAKLTAALNTDANKVASLLDGSTGPLSSLLTKLKTLQDPANTHAYVQAHTAGLTSEISRTQREELDRQQLIDNYTAMIEAQYAAMEATLATLQAQSSQIAAQLGQTTSSSSGSGLGNSNTN
jgi:flagellar hook-associated protein 2